MNFNPHLPRGRWRRGLQWLQKQSYFNPHLPRGRWRILIQSGIATIQFQSTPSSRKVTSNKYILCAPWHISIHTFLAEGDGFTSWNIRSVINFNPHIPRGRWHKRKEDNENENYFNPHLPRGRWQECRASRALARYFNPHLPRGRWHIELRIISIAIKISIHTFLAEGDYVWGVYTTAHANFNPHLPRGRWRGILSIEGVNSVNFNPHLPRGRWQNCRQLE